MGKMAKSALMAFISVMAEETMKSMETSISPSPMEMMAERRTTHGFRKRRFSKGGNRILNNRRKKGRQKIIP